MTDDDTTPAGDSERAVSAPENSGALATTIVSPVDEEPSDAFILKDDKMTSKKVLDRPIADTIRTSGEKLASEAGEKARGFVSQGLERTAEALANVSKMVGDTAVGIDERLGEEYGDYARKAATALDKAAGTIGSKNPDELIEDTRNFVRNSPGIAIAGAAVVGFVLARLLKSGLATDEDDEA